MRSRIQNVPPPAKPQPRIWTSLDLINWTKAYFEKKGIGSARLEAELLLAEVLGCQRIRLYADFEKPVASEKLTQFREYVRRRGEAREPLQYILGHCQFIDIKLKVTPAVLIPRPETELLAAWGLERTKESTAGKIRILDLGTGSGCLALYLAAKEPRASVVAADLSKDALDVAGANAECLQLKTRVAFYQGDLFDALPESERAPFDLIVSNPPYVDPALRETLQPEVRGHEPASALFADEAGLAVLRRIITAAPACLKPGAWMGLEFGTGQAEALQQIAHDTGAFDQIEIKADDAKLPRILTGRRR